MVPLAVVRMCATRSRLSLALFAACFVVVALSRPRHAFADSKQTCSDAYQKTQVLRAADKLEEAIEQADICVRTCNKSFVDECITWKKELEGRVASIIVEGVDEHGAAVTDGSVSLDGVPWLDQLGGPARVVAKGPHTLEVSVNDRPAAKKAIVVREGEKERRITISLSVAREPAAPSKVHRIGPWVVGGVGVATLIAGAITGGFVVDAYAVTQDECNDAKRECSQEGLDAQARGRLLGPVTTGLLVGGGTLVAASVVWLVAAPSTAKPAVASLFVAPSVSANDARLMLGGSW